MVIIKMKKILKILFFNFVFLILGIILIEIFFGKWIYKNNYGSLLIPNQSISVINQPYYDKNKTYIHSWDKNGFRANNYKLEDIDILVIGGSTTAEKFIDDNHIWTKVFERKIKHTKLKVLNAGIGGQTVYGHNKMFDLWFSNFEELSPQYVLIYLGINDAIKVHENFLNKNFDIKDNNYSRIRNDNLETISLTKKITQYIKNNSVFHLLYLIIRSSYVANKYNINNSNSVKLYDDNIIRKNNDKINLNQELDEEKKRVIKNFLPLFEKNIISIIKKVENLSAEPIFVTNLIPTDENADEFSKLLLTYLDPINDSTIKTCKKLEITCFDLRQKIELIYTEDFYDAIHTTPKGSAKIGTLISEMFINYLQK